MPEDKPDPTGADRVAERKNRLRGLVAGFTGVMNPELIAALDEFVDDAMNAAFDDGYAEARMMFDTEV